MKLKMGIISFHKVLNSHWCLHTVTSLIMNGYLDTHTLLLATPIYHSSLCELVSAAQKLSIYEPEKQGGGHRTAHI